MTLTWIIFWLVTFTVVLELWVIKLRYKQLALTRELDKKLADHTGQHERLQRALDEEQS